MEFNDPNTVEVRLHGAVFLVLCLLAVEGTKRVLVRGTRFWLATGRYSMLRLCCSNLGKSETLQQALQKVGLLQLLLHQAGKIQ